MWARFCLKIRFSAVRFTGFWLNIAASPFSKLPTWILSPTLYHVALEPYRIHIQIGIARIAPILSVGVGCE